MASAAETLRTYEDTSPESGNVLERSFCARCGCPVTGKLRTKREYTVVPVGAIDGPKDAFRPQAELFCVRRASWLGEIEGSTTFERMPTHLDRFPSDQSKVI
ncbi:hypothetical protein F4810DRAFT_707955 [Camillea tinctor]|nr:hypothetical protein F4810DRAFT_707955 [Camillea tinctor]